MNLLLRQVFPSGAGREYIVRNAVNDAPPKIPFKIKALVCSALQKLTSSAITTVNPTSKVRVQNSAPYFNSEGLSQLYNSPWFWLKNSFWLKHNFSLLPNLCIFPLDVFFLRTLWWKSQYQNLFSKEPYLGHKVIQTIRDRELELGLLDSHCCALSSTPYC